MGYVKVLQPAPGDINLMFASQVKSYPAILIIRSPDESLIDLFMGMP